MIKPGQWNNDNHEVLYALFIHEANNLFAREFKPEKDEEIIHRIMLYYFNQWEDRAVCEDKREFKVVCRDYSDTGNEYRSRLVLSHKTPLGPVVYNGDTITIEVVK